MKTLGIKLVAVFLLSVSYSYAASNGSVSVTGNIRNNTCIVDPSSEEFTVDLGDNASFQFFRVGAFSAWMPFSITFSSCGAAATAVRVGFTGTADSSNSSVLAVDSGAGMAEGIGIEIMDKSGTQIPLNASGSNLSWSSLTSGVSNTLNFRSRMIATRFPVTTGNVTATAYFTLEYQ